VAYADFGYYRDNYFGTAVSEEDFPRLAVRASSFLDYYTQGRAKENAGLDALKMACCALAEQYQQIDTAQKLAAKSLTTALESDGGELQSQSVGDFSKSYRSGGDSAKAALQLTQSANQAIAATARQYLAGTGLLYRGGRCGRCGHVSAYGDAL